MLMKDADYIQTLEIDDVLAGPTTSWRCFKRWNAAFVLAIGSLLSRGPVAAAQVNIDQCIVSVEKVDRAEEWQDPTGGIYGEKIRATVGEEILLVDLTIKCPGSMKLTGFLVRGSNGQEYRSVIGSIEESRFDAEGKPTTADHTFRRTLPFVVPKGSPIHAITVQGIPIPFPKKAQAESPAPHLSPSQTQKPGAVIKGKITLEDAARVIEVAIVKAPEDLVRPGQKKLKKQEPAFVFLNYSGRMAPDPSGGFEFVGLDPGLYFIELTITRGLATGLERPTGDDGKEIVLDLKSPTDVMNLNVVVSRGGSRRGGK